MGVEESQGVQEVLDYFSRPHSSEMQQFFEFHPQQGATNPVLQRLFNRTDDKAWKWLSYCGQRHALFYSVCLGSLMLVTALYFNCWNITMWTYILWYHCVCIRKGLNHRGGLQVIKNARAIFWCQSSPGVEHMRMFIVHLGNTWISKELSGTCCQWLCVPM